MAHFLAPEVVAELDDIWWYIATKSGNVETADRVIDSITDRFLLLARYPFLGRRRDHDLRAGLRSFVAGEYVIIYRPEDDVKILHVVRGSRNLEALFRSEQLENPSALIVAYSDHADFWPSKEAGYGSGIVSAFSSGA